MKQFILIDGNAIGYAQQLGMTRLSTGDQATHAIYGFLLALRKVAMPNSNERIPIVLWDGGAQWRKDICPDYKANRRNDAKKIAVKDEYSTQVPFIRQAITHLGIDQMVSPTCEADDLAGAYSRLLERQGHLVELVTGDKDWLQLVTPSITWNDPIRDRQVDIMTFESFTDYPNVEQFLDEKCLVGDTSDNIKGVGGIGGKGAKELLTEWGSVENFLANADQDSKMKAAWKRLLLDPSKFRDNRHLMYLDGKHPTIRDRIITKGNWSPDAFEKLCHELAFFSITAKIDDWLVPFDRF